MSSKKVILYISMSVDGFTATKDDDLSWLEVILKEGLDYGCEDLIEKIKSKQDKDIYCDGGEQQLKCSWQIT